MHWLEREAHGKQIVFYIFGCMSLQLIVGYAVLSAFHMFSVDVSGISSHVKLVNDITPGLFAAMFMAVITEEALFRFSPLFLAVELNCPLWLIILIAMISSMIFGYVHGNAYNIFIQGIGGFFTCLLFLKCGGLQSNYQKAFGTVIASHYLFNTVIIASIFFLR